jgi:hypothetical protein
MKIYKAIFLSALFVPALIFSFFIFVSVFFLGFKLFQNYEYNSGWIGIMHFGATCGFAALLVSSLPTVILGLPAILLAQKTNLLNKKSILLGAFLLGAMFLLISGSILLNNVNPNVFLWLMLAGGFGGLINGVVFIRFLKINQNSHPGWNHK